MRDPDPIVGLKFQPQYPQYVVQKCFIAYTEQSDWSEDLLEVCTGVLHCPEFNLEPDYARQHFEPDEPLRHKALELIANARYGIYDLSYIKKNDSWHMPYNVFLELGMAIALNRPILLLRHASNHDLSLPECLESVSGHILDFSGATTLQFALKKRLPQWINILPEQDWWNRFCHFGNRVCEYRTAHPQALQWGKSELSCYISDGVNVDFRGTIDDVLGRFNDVTYDYLDALPLKEGYTSLICKYCQIARTSPFAISLISSDSPAMTFIILGMTIAIEYQFEYKIPKIILTEDKQMIPSLLEGYEVLVACSDKKRKKLLREFIPTVIGKVRATTWKPKPLPFIETLPNLVEIKKTSVSEDEQEESQERSQAVLAAQELLQKAVESGVITQKISLYVHEDFPDGRVRGKNPVIDLLINQELLADKIARQIVEKGGADEALRERIVQQISGGRLRKSPENSTSRRRKKAAPKEPSPEMLAAQELLKQAVESGVITQKISLYVHEDFPDGRVRGKMPVLELLTNDALAGKIAQQIAEKRAA